MAASPDSDTEAARKQNAQKQSGVFRGRVKRIAGVRLTHFTWPWFACTMSTGALAVILSQQPYTFPGLWTIGKVFFIIDLVLLVVFCASITYRFVNNPQRLTKSLHSPQEALFFGSFWVSLALVLICTQQYGVPACGPWLVKAMEILFWIYAACALLVAIFQYSTLFVSENIPINSATPAWVFPVYPFLIIGPLAAVVVPTQPSGSALLIFVGGIALQGLGWVVALFMYTIYYVRLMAHELPPAPQRPGMFVGVGPAAYTATAFVALGNQAPNIIPPGFLDLDDFNVGAALKVLGTFAGIFVFLVAFWFFALSIVAILSGVRQMRFTLTWWAFIFPNVGLAQALIQIGNVLHSPGIQAIASGLTIVLVCFWFFVAASHIIALYRQEILWEGKDEDADDED